MREMRTWKWIALLVTLLVITALLAGCFEIFANSATGMTFNNPIGIFIQAFGPCGPASWIQQDGPRYCVMATAQTYGT